MYCIIKGVCICLKVNERQEKEHMETFWIDKLNYSLKNMKLLLLIHFKPGRFTDQKVERL